MKGCKSRDSRSSGDLHARTCMVCHNASACGLLEVFCMSEDGCAVSGYRCGQADAEPEDPTAAMMLRVPDAEPESPDGESGLKTDGQSANSDAESPTDMTDVKTGKPEYPGAESACPDAGCCMTALSEKNSVWQENCSSVLKTSCCSLNLSCGNLNLSYSCQSLSRGNLSLILMTCCLMNWNLTSCFFRYRPWIGLRRASEEEMLLQEQRIKFWSSVSWLVNFSKGNNFETIF